jgi:hypothetical protein
MALDDTFERRRRRRRRVRGPLTLLVLVGLLSGAAWYGYESVLNVPPPPVPTEVCATPSPKAKQHISSESVTVNVYNASEIPGLADRTASVLRQQGFTVDKVGNDPYGSKAKRVELRGRAKNAPELLLVAEQIGGETIRADDRTDATVDVIVGAKYNGLLDKAPKAIDVRTPIGVCVTVTPTPVARP